MRKFLPRHRPSPSMVVAIMALFVALGGTATAAGVLITGKQVKDGSLTGRDIKNDTVMGIDVLESSLAQVPSAATAGSASVATSANTATNATRAETASNAEKLDGRNSTEYMREWEALHSFYMSFSRAAGSGFSQIAYLTGVGTLHVDCAATARIWYRNGTPGSLHAVWWDVDQGARGFDVSTDTYVNQSLGYDTQMTYGSLSTSAPSIGLHYTIIVWGPRYARAEVTLARSTSGGCFGTVEVIYPGFPG